MIAARRGIGLATRATTKVSFPVVPPSAYGAGPVRQALRQPGLAIMGARPYVSTLKYSRDDVVDKLERFNSEVCSANWADYLYLVYNVPFWEAEMEALQPLALGHPDGLVGKKFNQVQELMDVLYQCEDVRDHINELCELATRASGFMGTGIAAEDKVENMDEHAEHCARAYQVLLDKHPGYKPKIEQTVGHGLAILRSKHKFKFGSMHRYFF